MMPRAAGRDVFLDLALGEQQRFELRGEIRILAY